MPVDKIKEAYEAVKNSGYFIDEKDFRETLERSPRDVYKTLKNDKEYSSLFIDENDFNTSLGLKKKAILEVHPQQ